MTRRSTSLTSKLRTRVLYCSFLKKLECFSTIDGTFIKTIKPKRHGDSYWCYKKHLAIILLAVVDARGRFTFISVGRPGSVGDAATYHGSLLKYLVGRKQWLHVRERRRRRRHGRFYGVYIRPYLVADAAFSSGSYPDEMLPGHW